MRFAVEQWVPEYGAAADDAALEQSDAPTDVNVEVSAAAWKPLDPPRQAESPRTMLFVDGVRRIDARVWLHVDGAVRPGLCATYAAGAVRCASQARLAGLEVRRGLFCGASEASAITTRCGDYSVVPTAGDGNEQLSLTLQERMGDLEVAVAQSCQVDGEPVIVDGPLRQHRHLPGAVGYIKSQHRAYGPAIVFDTATALAGGQRTPLFVVGAGYTRCSWYMRLPTGSVPAPHPFAGVVRCEVAGDVAIGEVAALADQITRALPRFASAAHKDPRAPQNLYPIAGLERALRRRLGDAHLLGRALRQAAAKHDTVPG